MSLKVSRKIYLELQKAIFRGEFKPGSRFPSERELAERFSASRSAVREAVAYLSELGLVKTLPQSGTYVADYETEGSLELLFSIMKATEVIDAGVLASLLKIRLVIEPPYTREAVLMADEESMQSFVAAGEALKDVLRKKRPGRAAVSESDFRFHFEIAHMTRDLLFQIIFNSFKTIYQFYTDIYYGIPGAAAATIAFVDDLIAAVAARDGDAAERIMREAVIDYHERLARAVDLKAGAPPIPIKPRG